MIRIEGLTKRYGRFTAAADVSLTIGQGESLALWGANGAGKTTIIRCVLGLLRFRGRVCVGGRDVHRSGKHARQLIGYVPQELGFYDELGVAEAIRFFGRLKGLAGISPEECLADVGLAGCGGKRVRELSGGMKQRLALAVALLGDPPVLVLDEVTASLDAVGRSEFVRLLERLTGSGRTLLFASHRLEEVAALAQRVALLERGRVVAVSACEDFLARMESDSVLHLHMPMGVREQAVRSLSAAGFAASLNGSGILVPVSPDRKAAPFRLLAEASIPVEDFELLSAARAAGRTHSTARHAEEAAS